MQIYSHCSYMPPGIYTKLYYMQHAIGEQHRCIGKRQFFSKLLSEILTKDHFPFELIIKQGLSEKQYTYWLCFVISQIIAMGLCNIFIDGEVFVMGSSMEQFFYENNLIKVSISYSFNKSRFFLDTLIPHSGLLFNPS